MSPLALRAVEGKRLRVKRRGFAIGAAAVVCGVALVWVLFGPAAVWLADHDVGPAKGSVLETALQNARSAYLTLAAGILAAGALIFTARNYRLSREGQVTDRYTKAIEQLGSDKADVRIGGIFALERIALDSARDHPTIMEVLSAFLREQSASPAPMGSLALFLSRQPASSGNGPWAARDTGPPNMPQDVRAAVTVIGRRDASRDRFHSSQGLDLEGANLARARLTNVTLPDANLFGAVLYKAWLNRANLTHANLNHADLRDAILQDAHLSEARLNGSDLRGAALHRANLHHANLSRANLRGAKLNHADLSRANLTDADVTGAVAAGADLSGALWPSSAVPPKGWQRGSDGSLRPILPAPEDDPEKPDGPVLPPVLPPQLRRFRRSSGRKHRLRNHVSRHPGMISRAIRPQAPPDTPLSTGAPSAKRRNPLSRTDPRRLPLPQLPPVRTPRAVARS